MTNDEKIAKIIVRLRDIDENNLDSLWDAIHDIIAIVKPSRLMFCGCEKCDNRRAVMEGKWEKI